MLGALIGLLIVVPAARRGWFVPKDTFQFPEKAYWERQWLGSLKVEDETETPRFTVLRAFSPYVLVVALLVITRTVPAVKSALTGASATIAFPNLFGTNISSSAQFLFSPGAILILVSLLCVGIFKMNGKQYWNGFVASAKTMSAAAPALLLAVPMVQVFIHSASADGTLASMPILLAQSAASVAGNAWPNISPWVGSLGAFIAGSNTVSNMMFSYFQFSTAQHLAFTADQSAIVVALQAVGGAAGNMICVHNVVAACAVVGMVNREGEVVRKTLIPMIYYVVMAGFIGQAFITGNMLWIAAAVIWLFVTFGGLSMARGKAVHAPVQA